MKALHTWCKLTDNNAATTVLSIDGVGAFDLISRRAMMEALHRMPNGDVILPFVLQFCGRPSTHLWEDEEGVVREIKALVAVQETLPSERLLAFLDDVYVASVPARIATVEESLEDALEACQDLDQSRQNSSVEQVWGDTT